VPRWSKRGALCLRRGGVHVTQSSVPCPFVAETTIPARAPGRACPPAAQVIECITHHVAHLHAHAHTMAPTTRDTLVSAWTSVIAASTER